MTLELLAVQAKLDNIFLSQFIYEMEIKILIEWYRLSKLKIQHQKKKKKKNTLRALLLVERKEPIKKILVSL